MGRKQLITFLGILLLLVSCSKGTEVQNPPDEELITPSGATYTNTQYGFKLTLAEDWSITGFDSTNPAPDSLYHDPFSTAETVALFENSGLQIVVLAGSLFPDTDLNDYVFKRKALDDLIVGNSEASVPTDNVYQQEPSSSGGLVRFIYQLHGDMVITFRLEIPADQADQEDSILEEFVEITETTTTDLSGTNTEEPLNLSIVNDNVPLVVGGNNYSLYIDNSDRIWTWGRNLRSSLGRPSVELLEYIPGRIETITNVISADIDEYSSIALKNDGTVWIWGSHYGDIYEEPTLVDGINNVTQVQINERTRILLKQDGTTWKGLFPPEQIEELTDIVKIASGGDHSLAIKSDGTAWAWGVNHVGQLGNGSTSESEDAPVRVTGLENVVDIEATDINSAALTSDGHVYIWGIRESGLINGDLEGDQTTPMLITSISNVINIELGREFAMALKSDGTVWTWGVDSRGQLGNGEEAESNYTPTQIPGLTNVEKIAAAYEHALIIKQDGSVWGWGSNLWGEIGVDTTDGFIKSESPILVEFPVE